MLLSAFGLRSRTLVWVCASLMLTSGAARAGDTDAELKALLDKQARLIEQQGKELQNLRRRLDELTDTLGAPLDTDLSNNTADKAAADKLPPLDPDAVKKIIADYVKKDKEDEKNKAEEKKKADEEKKKADDRAKKANDIFGGTHFNLQCLYDSLSYPKLDGEKKWYEKLNIRGYIQVRYGRTLEEDLDGSTPYLFGDNRLINGTAENFNIRRARLILFGDVSEHLYVYIQPDFASVPQGTTNSTFFAQLRDLYGDVYLDTDKVNRFRVGLSKVPYGWENMQSSQNRVPLDRTDAMNSAVAPNERDLGVFYYWTPVEKQKLLKTLVDSGLKGSGNYGIFAFGAYNGQGGSVFEANQNLHLVSRLTCPWQIGECQVVEASIQGYTGEYVVTGAQIRPLGTGSLITPRGTGRGNNILDQRAATTLVVYPQPFGFQCEWEVGRGPGLNNQQTAVVDRPLYGGYLMGMYKCDTESCGIWIPFVRWQQYTGGYRSIPNAPYAHQRALELGVEWQIRKEMELVLEYDIVNVPNLNAQTTGRSYRDFEGSVIRAQFQINY